MAPNGKRYKGILKDDEGETLGYKYEFYTDSHAFKSDLLCPRERVLHAGQVSTSWKKSQNAELKKGMLQLLKCCTLTDQKIRESLDAYAQGAPPPTSLENLVGQDDHSNEADEVMESDVEDAEDLDAPAASSQPVEKDLSPKTHSQRPPRDPRAPRGPPRAQEM
eukprot:400311-Pyramimonas_sp.AAC.2